jgi:enhancing lycopene biosynthesis protein 2
MKGVQMPKVAVILAGCGVFDGAEIHEAVLTLLALDRANVAVDCLAPDCQTLHVINHFTGDVASAEKRNVLVEAARISRGQIQALENALVSDYDAVIIVGGFGAAKNLCDFAVKGADCTVQPIVAEFIWSAAEKRIPLGFMCIAPVIAAKVLGNQLKGLRLTIGTDTATAKAIEKMGARHVPCVVTDCVIDKEHRVVSTPAYMLAQRITEAEAGISKLVRAVLDLI